MDCSAWSFQPAGPKRKLPWAMVIVIVPRPAAARSLSGDRRNVRRAPIRPNTPLAQRSSFLSRFLAFYSVVEVTLRNVGTVGRRLLNPIWVRRCRSASETLRRAFTPAYFNASRTCSGFSGSSVATPS